MTPKYRGSEWCDHEAGYVISREETVQIIPVNAGIPSNGFLNDYQEMPWKTGRYVKGTQNCGALLTCLLREGSTNGAPMAKGLASAPNFREAEVVMEALTKVDKRTGLSTADRLNIAQAASTNSQVFNNGMAKDHIPSLVRLVAPSLSATTREVLTKHGLIAADAATQ
jgi:hypothetical protein